MADLLDVRTGVGRVVATWRRRLLGLRHNPPGLAAVLAVLAALAPIASSVVRTALHRWVPVGDNGLLLLRTADVGTENHPWLGTWTSASITAGTDFNNPGPLLFDVLAIPVKLFGYGIGMPLGLGLLNGASVIGAAFVAFRQAGSRAVVAAMVAAGAVSWAMGSELLVDPWQPHSMMLPFLLLLTLLWGIVCGDLVLVVAFAAVSSLLVQTHVSYSFLVMFFTIAVAAAVVFHARRRADLRRRLPRIGSWVAGVVLVLWSQPFIEQLFGDRDGNLARLLANSSSDGDRIGIRLGTRLIADVTILPPWFARWNFIDAVPGTAYTGQGADRQLIVQGVSSLPIALGAVACFVTATSLLLWWALRGRQRVLAGALGCVLGLLASAAVVMTLMPTGVFGLSPHQMRWLWPISAFDLTVVVSSSIVLTRRWLSERGGGASLSRAIDRGAVVVGVAAIVSLAIAAAPTYPQPAGPTADRGAADSIVALMGQMSVLAGGGPFVFDDANLRFAEPYSGPVMARLGEMGVPFEVENPSLVRQVGDNRAISGTATGRLYLLEGDDAVVVPDDSERVAFVAGLDEDELAERDALVEGWALRLADGRVTLNSDGEAALASGALGLTQIQIDGLDDPHGVVGSGVLAAAATSGWLTVEPDGLPEGGLDGLIRLDDLQRRWRFGTVGLFLAPVG